MEKKLPYYRHLQGPMSFLTFFLIIVGCDGGGDNFLPSVERNDPRPNVIVVMTDDQGFADISAQEVVDDIQTPNIDKMAQNGVRMTAAYTTAPQCAPSRAGLVTGRYQQRFGLESNRYTPLPLSTDTIAKRLQDCGYATGFVGKWHLDIDNNSVNWFQENYPSSDPYTFGIDSVPFEVRKQYFPDSRGFDDVYYGKKDLYWCNFNFKERKVEGGYVTNNGYRLDVITEAALAFIDRHQADPFFLVVSYYGPHVPLEAPSKYLENIPTNMPERRRYALAMIAAIDSGVGAIMDRLDEHELQTSTMVFFVSDNGAPLGIHMEDVPITNNSGVWDGSLNDPWVGEKGMLSEGGVRVPFLVQWEGKLPHGIIFNEPVSTLDIGATALSVAESPMVGDLDGIDLVPILTGEVPVPTDRVLYWRFWDQVAMRKGNWKYLLAGNREFLFRLDDPNPEFMNIIDDYPTMASEMKAELTQWAQSMKRPRMTRPFLTGQELEWYNAYFSQ